MNQSELQWKDADGIETPFDKLTDDELSKCIYSVQQRQIRAFSTLELAHKLETKLREQAKKRKITLVGIEDYPEKDRETIRWNRFKDVISRINRVIKLNLTKDAKTEAVLQKTSS